MVFAVLRKATTLTGAASFICDHTQPQPTVKLTTRLTLFVGAYVLGMYLFCLRAVSPCFYAVVLAQWTCKIKHKKVTGIHGVEYLVINRRHTKTFWSAYYIV